MREVRIWRPFRAGEMSQIAAVNALSDAYVTYDDYKRLAGDLDDAQTRIVELKQEIAEDAKATAESQETTGKYMADAEAAQREIELLKKIIGAFSRLRIGKYVSWGNAGGPNECEHGRADGIPCPTCDAEIVSAATGGQG